MTGNAILLWVGFVLIVSVGAAIFSFIHFYSNLED